MRGTTRQYPSSPSTQLPPLDVTVISHLDFGSCPFASPIAAAIIRRSSTGRGDGETNGSLKLSRSGGFHSTRTSSTAQFTADPAREAYVPLG